MTAQLNLNCMDVVGADYQPQTVLVEDKIFEGARIPVDNHQYSNCQFRNCAFLYSGGPFAFFDCSLEGEGGYLNLTGHADRVLRILNVFRDYHARLNGPY